MVCEDYEDTQAWSGCANEYLRRHSSGDILSYSCEVRDVRLQLYRGMALR